MTVAGLVAGCLDSSEPDPNAGVERKIKAAEVINASLEEEIEKLSGSGSTDETLEDRDRILAEAIDEVEEAHNENDQLRKEMEEFKKNYPIRE